MAAHVGKHCKYVQAEDSKNIGKPENNDFFFTCHKILSVRVLCISFSGQNNANEKFSKV